MRHFTHDNRGTCSKQVIFDIDDEKRIHNLQFVGGCPSNTIGLSQLVEGMKAEEVIERLQGIRCGMKPTSCPDQLASAVVEALADIKDEE